MSALRKQMEADMAIRGLAYRTRERYVGAVAQLARHYRAGPIRSVTAPLNIALGTQGALGV